jgi:hypothetical protein
MNIAELIELADKLRLPALHPDAPAEERALRAIVESGRARLSPATMAQLRAGLPDHPDDSPRATPLLGEIKLIIDPAVPDGYLVAIPDDRPPLSEPAKLHDWLVRSAVVRDLAGLGGASSTDQEG